MSRSYTKRNSEYWDSRKAKTVSAGGVPITINTAPQSSAIQGEPFPEIEAYADCAPESTSNVRGTQVNNGQVNPSAFQNLSALPLPYIGYNGTRSGFGYYGGNGFGGGYIGVSSAIELCGRAWAGVPPCRNAVEIAVEFSNQPLYIKCKNQTVKRFFEEWLGAIRINRLKEEFFREYYRSGNVFLLLFEGRFGPKYFQHFQTTFSAKENRIPIRYELLNPTNVFVPVGMVANYTYVRLLSTYEITRLQNPLTPQDKQVYNDLPIEAKDQIRNYNAANPMGIYIPLEGKRLRFAFYKKQSYEPLAVPMLWPVLPDIEWKLTLKKMDKALLQNVERVILLITTGEAPNQWNGGKGINQRNISNLQSMLSNQTLNRVLVADYSTKALFIQPDLKDLGPEKYAIVNEDIREGLQSIFTGDDKFANAQIKAKVFVRRLEEGWSVFLDDFLNIEVARICDIMGFRDKPLIRFRKINLSDEAVMARVVAQLAQLGILTGKQTVNTLESGVLPDQDEMDAGQEEYVKEREDGKYYPLVGGSQDQSGEEGAQPGKPAKKKGGATGRPVGTGTPKTSNSPGPIGTSKGHFSMKEIVAGLRERSNMEDALEREVRKTYAIKGEMSEAQKNAVATLSFSIMAAKPRGEWVKSVKSAVKNAPVVSEAAFAEIDEIRKDWGLRDAFEAVVVKNART